MNSFNGFSFDEIVEKYSDMITRICILNLKNTEDAKEETSETEDEEETDNEDFEEDIINVEDELSKGDEE